MKERRYVGPPMRSSRVIVTRGVARRLDQVVQKLGRAEAARRVGVGPETLESALEEGGLLAKTMQRLLKGLEKVETEVKGGAA